MYNALINYKFLSDAIEFYKNLGYKYIEVPWYVTDGIMSITRPEYKTLEDDFSINIEGCDRYLVASSEQSFISEIINNKLSYGKYVAITPCFRNDILDELHQKHFMKVELINYYYDTYRLDADLNKLMFDAHKFYNSILNDADKLKVVETKDPSSFMSYDIEYKGIELGSYGVRSYNDIKWIYGTGCAEPRLSIAIKGAI